MIGKRLLAAAMLVGVLFTPLAAQNATQPAPGGTGPGAAAPGGPGGGFGNFDPALIRQRILERFKTGLECTDDEWKVLEPKVAKIVLLQLDVTNLGMFNQMARGRAGRGGMGGMFAGGITGFVRMILDPDAPPSPVEEKTRELQELIDNNETSTDFYKTKLMQLRKAREKAQQDLAAAQKDITSLLTVRQEATLVQLGLLE